MNGEKKTDVVVVLLAAGSSSRLGSPKQLITWQGEPLLRLITRRALQTSAGAVVVVLGAYAEQVVPLIANEPVHAVLNPQWATGLGSSIHRAIRFIQQSLPLARAALLMVCDQPFVSTEHLEKLISRYHTEGAPIVASAYSGIAGVPALFDKTLFGQLLELSPEAGAGKIIRNSGFIVTIDFPEGKFDIDTPDDLNELNKLLV